MMKTSLMEFLNSSIHSNFNLNSNVRVILTGFSATVVVVVVVVVVEVVVVEVVGS